VFLPLSISWVLTIAFVSSCGWFLYQGARSSAGVTDRISLLAHAVMCVAMVAMVWPWGTRLPPSAQFAALGSSALWFLLLAVRARRTTLAVANAHHTLMAFVMIWMVVAALPAPSHPQAGNTAISGMSEMPGMSDMPGMSEMPGPSTAALVFGVYFLVAALVGLAAAVRAASPGRPLRSLSKATGHAVMSVGAGVLALVML
jgi:hypothetical protein